MLVRLARPLLFRYRFADARKLPNIWDINPTTYNQMANAMFGAYSCQAFGILLKENLTSITDQQVAYALIRINELKLDADDHFYESIVPVVKDFVANFNKEHSVSLAQIVAACGQLNAKDNTLWELFEQKLLNEKLYRYIPLNNLVEMTVQVARSEFGSQKFFQTMESQIAKHSLALSDDSIKECLQAFELKKLNALKLRQLYITKETSQLS